MLAAAPSPDAADVVRQMPHALGPEKSILSSMLKDPDLYIGRALEQGITREHFYVPAHGRLFEILRRLNAQGKEIELVSLTQVLHDKGQLDAIGGPGALSDIYTYAPNGAHFDHHLDLVKDKHVLRQVIKVTTATCAEAFENPEEVAPLLDSAEASILAIRNAAERSAGIDLKGGVAEVIRHMERLINGEQDSRGIPTGYADLDRMSKGLKPGEMFVVAARPSMGKTSFMMNVAEHVAIDQGIPTMVFSCEMTAFQVIQRLVYSRARFAMSKLSSGFVPRKEELIRIKRAAEEIATAKMFIDDTPGLMIDALRAKARRRVREDGVRFICIDYLQLLRSGSRQAVNSREREIGEISAGIKGLAKELGLPILVLAQLNRGPEGRTGASLGKPRMSDLRESGTIEQDADMIGLLFRAAYYAETQEERDELAGEAELVVAKNRNGETGQCPLTFISELMRFETRARETTTN